MNVRELRWARYRVPFAADFTTAHGQMAAREGLILWLETDAGVTGLGEAAPLPEFGGGSVVDVERLLESLGPSLIGTPLADLPTTLADLAGRSGGAALACGLDTAALDALGRAAGVPIANLLAAGAVAPAVPVNATVGVADTTSAVEAAQRAVAAGFGTVKLKVGVAASADAEVERVAAVRSAIGPGVRLRLDANGAWTPAEAIATLRRLAAFDLELVEQPVAADDLAGLAQVRRAVAEVPIAADEAAVSVEAIRAIAQQEAADVVMVKPMVLGGLRAARAIIDEAAAAGMAAIVTSTVDTGIGVAAALHLAATLPAPLPACGLATGALLATDLLERPLPREDGHMALPLGAGLGVALDPAALRAHTVSR